MTPLPNVTRPVARTVGWAAAVTTLAAAGLIGLFAARPARGAWVWVEGEKPFRSTMHRHPWWYDKVQRGQLSGGDFLSNWSETEAGEASYRVQVPAAGSYEFWVRANPLLAKMSYRLGSGPWTPIDLNKDLQGNTNIAEDGKADLRFIAWARVGDVALARGVNVVSFRMESPNNHHGYLDCFVFSSEPFAPDGTTRPDQISESARRAGLANRGWFAFTPPVDRYSPASAIDLRGLNEKEAGDGGFIAAKNGEFVHSRTGKPVRFWAVNGPPGKDIETLRRDAKVLAKRGVNLARVHHGNFDTEGVFDNKSLGHSFDVVEALKAEGIYSYFSIYFPIWLAPKPGNAMLPGYDGQQHPFAALMFNPAFQERYRQWWKDTLLTPSPKTGKPLVEEPALMGLEIQNEDSFFFWTFEPKNIPDVELRLIEGKFGDWLKARYGSIAAALRRWGNERVDRDDPAAGRVGFRPLWNVFNQKTPRDRDATRFLAETQRAFYEDTYRYLRGLGFKGTITASNWITASPEVFGPIEKYTYTVTDFVDRHGYFASNHKGDSAEWSVRDGHTFSDRSALRFDPEEPGKPRLFVHPAMDTDYDGKPSMISEVTWNRPNRFRTEAPLYLAAYGALQGTDAIVHFTFDGSRWAVQPEFFMQPWTLMAPSQMGQFPAAALIYRKRLVAEGDVLADLTLRPDDLFALKGTPLPQDASLDELRLKDVPKGAVLPRAGQVIDPLIHYAGRTTVRFSDKGTSRVKDLRPYIDHTRQTVVSTTGELKLDYGKGVLTINAPAAQGVSGNLKAAGTTDLRDLSVSSGLDNVHVVAVSLDDRPLATSRKILLQVMTEEKPTGFYAEPAGAGIQKIVHIGRDPWLVKEVEGTVRFKRPDASALKVTSLDPNGDPLRSAAGAAEVHLEKAVVYYLIEAGGR